VEAAITAARLDLHGPVQASTSDRIAFGSPASQRWADRPRANSLHRWMPRVLIGLSRCRRARTEARAQRQPRAPAVWALRAQTDKRQYARQMLQPAAHPQPAAARGDGDGPGGGAGRATNPNHNQDGSGNCGPDHRRAHFFWQASIAAPAVILHHRHLPRGADWVGQQSMSACRAARGRRRPPPKRCRPSGFRKPVAFKTGTPARVGPAAVEPWISSKSSPATPKAATSPVDPSLPG